MRGLHLVPRISVSHEAELPSDLSEVRTTQHRDDARRRVPVLPRLSGLRRSPKPEAGRLLRVLLVRIDSVPADATRRGLLQKLTAQAVESQGRASAGLTLSQVKRSRMTVPCIAISSLSCCSPGPALSDK